MNRKKTQSPEEQVPPAEPSPHLEDPRKPASSENKGKRVAMVLGSGGARGYAHVGVLEEVVSRGHEVVSIAGCSMGALVGGVFASGKLSEFRDWALNLDRFAILKLIDFSWSSRGAIRGDKVFSVVSDLVGDICIEDLPMDYTAVATEILSQKEVWFQQGSLLDAIRASVAIPSLIRPHEKNGRLYVDGGLLNPLPIIPTIGSHADRIIAVNLSHYDANQDDIGDDMPLADDSDPGLFDMMNMAFETMQSSLTQYKIAGYPPDVLINIPKRVCKTFEYHRAPELIDLGRRLAAKALDAEGL